MPIYSVAAAFSEAANGNARKCRGSPEIERGSEESLPMGALEASEANRNIKMPEPKAHGYTPRFAKTPKPGSSSGGAFLSVASINPAL